MMNPKHVLTGSVLSLFLLANILTVATGEAAAAKPKKNAADLTAEQTACMRKAMEKRESAVMGTLMDFTEVVRGKLVERRKLLMVAWAEKGAIRRQQMMTAIWRNFGQSWRDSGTELRKTRRKAWEQYRSDRSDCGVGGRDEETAGIGADSAL